MTTINTVEQETGKNLIAAIASPGSDLSTPDEGHCQVTSSVADERFDSLLESAIDGIIVIDEQS